MKRETISLQTCLSKDSYFKLIQAVLRAHLLHASLCFTLYTIIAIS